ncbi:MAG: epoxyqueuosine reductase QueH, partial [Oscillospiraceae bacterium]|nr:epoxyqueuosine reductase QueH [Oscillospiraceae bacterium]
FLHRIEEQKRLISELPCKNSVEFIEHGWQEERFYAAVKGLENIPEGGERCFACYRLRLEETAKLAAEMGFDYFTTTLSISPYKNADKLNEIGEELAEKYGVKHLPSDFKKKNGYKRSIELSAEYGLYRQNYCGCVFSKKEREQIF